jgi:microcin C transport system substrate-binding protein
MHGEPKYGPDFTHFDYVNPDAPKGGMLRQAEFGTFDSFHGFIPKGHAGPSSSVETLLTSSADEPFTEYGLIAESLEVPDDRSWAIFTLRPEARWHDGEPITVEDVIWSLEILKTKGHPQYRFYYKNVVDARKVGPRRVKFTFDEKNNRELPLIVGQLPILPKHYWQGRDFEATTLEPPLASGPYRVANFEPGRFVELERVEDYWGKDLPVNKGRDNFDRIRYEYYRDETILREALKAGRIDYHRENIAKVWALDYLPNKVPAIRNGRLNKEEIAHRRPTGMQAFFFNTHSISSGPTKTSFSASTPAPRVSFPTLSSPPPDCPREKSSKSSRASAGKFPRKCSPPSMRHQPPTAVAGPGITCARHSRYSRKAGGKFAIKNWSTGRPANRCDSKS